MGGVPVKALTDLLPNFCWRTVQSQKGTSFALMQKACGTGFKWLQTGVQLQCIASYHAGWPVWLESRAPQPQNLQLNNVTVLHSQASTGCVGWVGGWSLPRTLLISGPWSSLVPPPPGGPGYAYYYCMKWDDGGQHYNEAMVTRHHMCSKHTKQG